MGLFNNLRKRIVHKLIRPEEDGYIPTGYPTKLYRDVDSYQYGMERTTMVGRNHYKPTLTGWVASAPSSNREEVEFTEWIFGVLGNLYTEYSKRLEKITLKELKKFQKKEKREPLVINKQSFCNIMHALDEYWENLIDLRNVLDVVFEDNMLTHIHDSVVDALVEDMEPDRDYFETPIIHKWLFDFDCGRNQKAKEGIDGHPLTSAEELYDYLMYKRNLSETLDKLENM